MENNKLKVKDLVNIGIFSALYMVISMIVMIPVGIAPILWLIWPGIAGLFGGAFFTLLMTKVPKQGAALILAIITGLLYFATGECTWVIIVTFAVAGILGEAARKVLGYKSFKGIALAGGFTAFGFIGSPLPMWLFQDAYMKSIEEMGMGVEYVEGLQSMISAGSFIGMLAVAFVGGLIGTLVGRLILTISKTYNAALATLLTSRGVPNIYYGTEQYVVPADGSDVSGRIFMQTDSSFDTDTTAYKLIGKLSELRQQNDAIAYGTTTIRYSNDDVLIYERKFYDDVILVAINRQPDKAYTIDNVETLLPEGEYVDFLGGMLNGENISVYASTGINTTASITLDGGEVGVWQYDAAASAPEIGNVVSTMGRAGNRVYIYGDGLDGNISVKFGETEATVESNTANEIVTYVPDNAVAGYNDITVTKGDAVSNSFTYNVLSGDQNQVIFHVKAETSYGENIYIVGNVPELGSWNPDKCTEALLNPNYPEWFLPVSVPAGTEIQFKFIKKDANGTVTWESGDNRVITSSSLSAGTVDTEVYTWRN